ncbi:hypothetical protein L6452_00871 [Arctium lappa]|uniref:Uncharacterized protein n=1 Tax=Arctium lappa TaxID=4217 RepID=A0ACB9FG40_ARCLA|nr:hypothetical protein L6452_00871 [Arctium lappa]
MKQIARRLPVRRSGRRPATAVEPHVAADPLPPLKPPPLKPLLASTPPSHPPMPKTHHHHPTNPPPPSTTDVPPPQTTETQKPPVEKPSSEPLIEGKMPQDQAVSHSIPTALDGSRLLDGLHGSSCHGYWARLLLKIWAADF